MRALAKQVQVKGRQVLSGNLNTVNIPSDIVGTHSNSHHLVTNAHVLRCGNRDTGQLGACQLGNINSIGNRASCSIRGVINTSGVGRNRDGSSSGSTHRENDRGTGTGDCTTILRNRPVVCDILVAKTIKVGVQGNHTTLASAQLRSVELQIAAKLIDGEVGCGFTTALGSRH